MAAENQGSGSIERKIRVLTLVDYPSLQGGAERLAVMIATRLDSDRFESTLCLSRWPPTRSSYVDPTAEDAIATAHAAGVPVLPLHRRRKVELGAWIRLESHLRRHRFDVLHAHKFGSNVWGTIAGRAAKVPVILAHEHTWSYEGQPLRRALDRHLIARYATRFLAVSTADRRRMIEIEHIPTEKTLYIPNAIAATPPTPGRNMRAELGIESDENVVGIVALLRPQKAHRVLLHAAAQLMHERPRLRVLIAGDGSEAGALRQCATDLGIAERVSFLGTRSDVPDVLSAFDVAVCCSDFEGSPLSVMEYMAAGLPIVATEVGGIPDLIDSGVHGLLVPPREPTMLAGAIRRLLDDRDLAARLGDQARIRQRSEFDFPALTARLESLYVEMLVQSGRISAEARDR